MKRCGPSLKTFRCGAVRLLLRATWSSTARWMDGSKPSMREMEMCCGSSSVARESSASRSRIAVRTASSTSRSFRELVAGPARSSPVDWIRATRLRRSASWARWVTCPTTRREEACSMCSRFPKEIKILFLLAASACASHKPAAVATVPQITRPAGVLRVCADPNNLPFSNQRGEGFENKIAELLAHDLGERVEYTWWAQRRGFFRNTLKAGMCDVVMGVQIIGNDQTNAPPAHALTRRNIIDNVKGFTLYGDYSQPNPPARIVDAVAKGDIDLAIVWGPLAGYRSEERRVPMQVVPVTPQIDQPFLPFVFDISMGVRRGDQDLRDQLEQVLEQRRADIDRILEDYKVPRVEGGQGV